MRKGWFFVGGLLVTLIVAGLLSGFASSSPDGLEKVAGDKGVSGQAKPHDMEDSPFADYEVAGVDGDRLATGIAGVTGVLVTLGAGSLLFYVLRRRTPQPEPQSEPRPEASSGPPRAED